LFKDGSKQTIHQTSAIWAMNKKRVFIDVKTRVSIESAQLISGIFMNADFITFRDNNKMVSKKTARRIR